MTSNWCFKKKDLINLIKFFGDINLLEVFQIDNWESKIQNAVNEIKHSLKMMLFYHLLDSQSKFFKRCLCI